MAEPLEIRCRENGPYVIKGPVRIIDHHGNAFEIPAGKEAVALCRCGQSKRRPFCDGSHRECGFQAGETAGHKERTNHRGTEDTEEEHRKEEKREREREKK